MLSQLETYEALLVVSDSSSSKRMYRLQFEHSARFEPSCLRVGRARHRRCAHDVHHLDAHLCPELGRSLAEPPRNDQGRDPAFHRRDRMGGSERHSFSSAGPARQLPQFLRWLFDVWIPVFGRSVQGDQFIYGVRLVIPPLYEQTVSSLMLAGATQPTF